MESETRPVLLEPAAIVLPGKSVARPEVDRARAEVRAAAATVVPWAREPGTSPADVGIALSSAKDLQARLMDAAFSGHTGVRALQTKGALAEEVIPARSWTIGAINTAVPDPLTIADARRSGGLVLDNAERWDPTLADLADLVAAALDAHVRISIVTGHASVSALGDGYWEDPAVLPIGGPAVVQCDAGELEVQDGEAVRLRGLRAVQAAADVVVGMVGIREPLLADLWGSVVHVAGFWPRLRMDLPRDPKDLTDVYGEVQPTSPVDLALDTLREQLLIESVAEQCLAWWRANVLPAARPGPQIGAPASHVRPLLPCGVGFVEDVAGEDAPRGAAGGWVFDLGGVSTSFVASLVEGRRLRLEALSGGEFALVSQLLDLGLAGWSPS